MAEENVVRISRRAAERLASGHLWVYRSDVERVSEALAPGTLVTVEDGRGKPLGSGLYSTASQIVVRMVSEHAGLSRVRYLVELRARVDAALQRRKRLAGAQLVAENIQAMLRARTEPAPDLFHDVLESNGSRLVFSEADNLPGIVVDRYNDLIVVQLLTQGTAQEDVRRVLTEALRDDFLYRQRRLTIWERPDPRIRELEQLPPAPEGALFSTEAEAPGATVVTLNGLRFEYDASAGQKTGAFLDQRLNYAAAARHVFGSGRVGRALDVCTYHGGFALHLAEVCERVTGVDQSRTALEAADRNAALNTGRVRGEVDWVEADAFELLRAMDDARRGRRDGGDLPVAVSEAFDAIVLDPPAFAKSKRAAEGALRGYKELNLRALRLLAPGGTLVTCSCSHHVSLQDFTEVVSAAAADAGRRVQLLETRGASPDHPEVLTLPETRYLKCLICRVE